MQKQKTKEEWESYGKYPIVLAPMVDMCDLPFRIQCRRHNIKCCWTGMINTNQWNRSKKYRQSIFCSSNNDKPLVMQISGSIDSGIVDASKSLSAYGTPIDINLGCCQKIAKRSEYGYFLVDKEDKRRNVIEIIREVAASINVPLYAKIRQLTDSDGNPNVDITVDFAKELAKAGVCLITVHARPASQDKKGPADYTLIQKIVESVDIPVVANGGINSLDQAIYIMKETGCTACMSAQQLLHDPSSFDPECKMDKFELALEYLDLFDEYGSELPIARRHMFYRFESELEGNSLAKERLGTCRTSHEIRSFIRDLKSNNV